MLSDFTWNMTGYIPKHAVNPHGDGIISYVAERAYRRAVDKLTELLVAEGAFHAVRLKQKSETKRKKKIAAAVYEYQADCDGEWGEISFDFENGTAEIVQLADWDTMKTYQNEKSPSIFHRPSTQAGAFSAPPDP